MIWLYVLLDIVISYIVANKVAKDLPNGAASTPTLVGLSFVLGPLVALFGIILFILINIGMFIMFTAGQEFKGSNLE